ncbi:MAG TPA: ABC transporter ATP-binding protein [Firmicutes bacterium]|uniref:ABC transporter ATP-binding protein n=2 Tax=Capillibacterium thermochitinicola TaxID=2699427 RepID=A0A8J6HZE5_9FIRM|nr:ABC transporter ATP-binding protein [Capillibacterium thermochitinicola]HHW12025.1 ABC transporter ATP-binding protein [Bacillota bacterium]
MLENLVKRYHLTKALDGVNLSIDRGKVVGLLGPNGSGKTTLLKIVAGLRRPSRGQVRVFGMIPGPETKKRVAFLPEVNTFYNWMTVDDLLEFVKSFHPDLDLEKADSLKSFMNLKGEVKIGALSKGQQARLKLIVGLSRQAELMLLDEPLAGIDPPSRAKILHALVGEFRQEGQTIVISTHEVKEAEPIFDHVVFLREGRIALEGEAETLREETGRSMEELFEEVLA